ncbi:PREDICTED: uncharacterized protein LOC109228053 [Nicotiana attenuata]|uniref:uncharacterized protein LOC109228053 n=1 Tax=Nicotiana attenuata TaxID=49451 RepID=UPI0009054F06|nr:PREDICTED: uncharacterized protein LOC109228053 [Nicotiana attenuata]
MDTTLLVSSCLSQWIIDTGATNHMVADKKLLDERTVNKSNNPKKVLLHNGDITTVTHIGTSSILENTTLFPDFCVFQELFTGKVKGIGKENAGLYLLYTNTAERNKMVALIAKENDTNKSEYSDIVLWHRRCGHVSTQTLKKILHIDTDTIRNRINKCTHFFRYVKTQFDTTVKIIRTDNGSEFVNSVCEQMFKELGTIHQRTCVYTPQQNGVAERKHRHILEVTRAIRFQAQIPITFWGYCVLAAVYLINRMPSIVIGNMSPFERLHKRKPSLMHLRIIGCLCFAKTVQEHDKLMPRAKLAIHMGYSEIQKGYILYDLTTNLSSQAEMLYLEKMFFHLQ